MRTVVAWIGVVCGVAWCGGVAPSEPAGVAAAEVALVGVPARLPEKYAALGVAWAEAEPRAVAASLDDFVNHVLPADAGLTAAERAGGFNAVAAQWLRLGEWSAALWAAGRASAAAAEAGAGGALEGAFALGAQGAAHRALGNLRGAEGALRGLVAAWDAQPAALRGPMWELQLEQAAAMLLPMLEAASDHEGVAALCGRIVGVAREGSGSFIDAEEEAAALHRMARALSRLPGRGAEALAAYDALLGALPASWEKDGSGVLVARDRAAAAFAEGTREWAGELERVARSEAAKDHPVERGLLLFEAGRAVWETASPGAARGLLEEAVAAFEGAGDALHGERGRRVSAATFLEDARSRLRALERMGAR